MVKKDQLAEDIRRVGDELGRAPTTGEYTANGQWHYQTAYKTFGSWSEALRTAGYAVADAPEGQGADKIPDDALLDDIKQTADKASGRPTTTDYEKYGSFSLGTVVARFGSWTAAVNLARSDNGPSPGKSDIIRDVRRVKDYLHRVPTSTEYESNGKYSLNDVLNKFGSWSDLLKQLNGNHRSHRTELPEEEADMLRNVADVCHQLQRVPKIAEYEERGDYSRSELTSSFGSWRKIIYYALTN